MDMSGKVARMCRSHAQNAKGTIGGAMQMLVKSEQKILAECEATIQKGLATFMDVGSALMRIRDGRLYRVEYKTFEAYCQEKWGIARAQAYRLMDASTIAGNLSPIGDKPATESQVRPLAGLEPEEQREVWISATEKAEEEGRKVTAKDVEMAKAEIIEDAPIRFTAMDKAEKAKFILSSMSGKNSEKVEALQAVIDWCRKEIRRMK